MAFIEIKDLTFAYCGHNINVLDGVSLTVQKGSFTVIAGRSGCGKTTLLRRLKPEIAPHGTLGGTIMLDGKSLCENGGRFTPSVGFVMQDPDSQIITDKVWHELAFGLESIGTDTQIIRRRVAEMASFFGIQDWYHMDTNQLSGGQKQLLNLASVMVMQPSVLVLDEPTSRLDPISASEFISAVVKLNRELGITVIMTEHRLDDLLPICTALAIMDGGKIICCGPPLETALLLKSLNHGMFTSMPVPCRVWSAVTSDVPCPLTVSEGKVWLENFTDTHGMMPLPARTESKLGAVTAELSEIYFKYDKNLPNILNHLSLSAHMGELLAVIGGNGTGKSTMLSLLAGINKPYRGSVKLCGKAALLPQDPKMLFLHSSVYDELLDVTHDVSKINEISALCGISHLLQQHPYDLSGGEQQKAAFAKILLTDPDIILCDEPTKGLDSEFKIIFADILKKLQNSGKTIIMVSHDIEFCAAYADNVAMLFDGEIVSSGNPAEFFSQNSFYTTASGKMARSVCPKAVTADDIITICGGTLPSDPTLPPPKPNSEASSVLVPDAASSVLKAPPASRILTTLALLFAVPLTIYFGLHIFGARKYLIVSLLVMLETSFPFVLMFERRRPRARELVLIASLCAIAIAGRAVFAMFPQFKPVLAIVIIAGASLGVEAGSFVGSITMLVSNILFSQGSWTPWQMFAAGAVGAVSGLIFYRRNIKNLFALCLFGFFSAIVIYGGIMNPASVLMFQEVITPSMLITSYATGFPMDMIHALATVLFLFFLSGPMIEKIDRIKMKYGIIFA